MNIIMVGHNLWVQGGSDKVMLDQIEMLEEREHVVAPFVALSDKNFDSRWSSYWPSGASFINPKIKDAVNFVYSKESKLQIRRLIEDFNPDLVHMHIYYGKITSSIISEVKKNNIPLIQTLHEYKTVCPVYNLRSNGNICTKCTGFKYYHGVLNKCNRNSMLRSALSVFESYVAKINGAIDDVDQFVTVSDFQRDTLISMGMAPGKLTTIYNPIDTDKFMANYKPGDYYLFYGRIESEKGISTLIDAFKALSHLNLLVIGEGSMLDYYKSFCLENKMFNITFSGYKFGTELFKIIADSKTVIIPSIWYETFGLTVAESMMLGKPVIISDIGAFPEVVGTSIGGLKFEAGSVEDLVEKILFIESCTNDLESMGIANREQIVANFSREVHYNKLIDLYKKYS